jgi:hypothetical protein
VNGISCPPPHLKKKAIEGRRLASGIKNRYPWLRICL